MVERVVQAGEVLIVEGDEVSALYELQSGSIEVVRAGVTVAVVSEPGALFGELSLLLDRPAMATVRACSEVVVVEIDDARERLGRDLDLMARVARLLAGRLDLMTGYLADLRNQYGDHQGGLGMIDSVLASLTHAAPIDVEPGSEREPDPPY